MKIPVSVAIITRNEEKKIREALESVKDFEEIVIVDSFSDDRTVEICRNYTDRIFQIEWRGYSEQKSLAISKTTLNWVLVIDADERVTEELKKEIMEKIKDQTISGYYIPRKNFFLGKWIKHCGWWPDYTLRLFQRQTGRLDRRLVHEKIVVNGKTDYLREPLLHYTYESIEEFIEKMQKYSTLSALDFIGQNPSKFKVLLKLFFSPPFTFFKMFIIRKGFLDGQRGLILSLLYSFHSFLKYAKSWERKWK